MILSMLVGCSGDLSESFFLRVDGADLMVDVEGNPEPGVFVLLLHGGPGGSSQDYNGGTWAAEMEAEAVMVYLDQRGQGASAGIYDDADVTIERLVEDVAVVIEALRLRYGEDIALYLMGHSWGGLLGTATLLTTDAQAELAGWIEIDGAHDVPLLNRYAVPMFIDKGSIELAAGRNEEAWSEIVAFAEGVDVERLTAEDSLHINRYAHEAESLIGSLAWDAALSGTGSLEYLLASPLSPLTAAWTGGETNLLLDPQIEQTSLTDDLRRITLPTLLVWGAYDFVVPPGLGEDAAARIPDSELVVLERSGHTPMFNQPDDTAASVLDFIDRTR